MTCDFLLALFFFAISRSVQTLSLIHLLFLSYSIFLLFIQVKLSQASSNIMSNIYFSVFSSAYLYSISYYIRAISPIDLLCARFISPDIWSPHLSSNSKNMKYRMDMVSDAYFSLFSLQLIIQYGQ